MPVGRYARGLVELMRAASLTAELVERVGQPFSVSWYTAQRQERQQSLLPSLTLLIHDEHSGLNSSQLPRNAYVIHSYTQLLTLGLNSNPVNCNPAAMLSRFHRWSFHLAISLYTKMTRLQTAPAVLAGSIVMYAQPEMGEFMLWMFFWLKKGEHARWARGSAPLELAW